MDNNIGAPRDDGLHKGLPVQCVQNNGFGAGSAQAVNLTRGPRGGDDVMTARHKNGYQSLAYSA